MNTLSSEKTELFETMPIPQAVAKLAIPTIVGCLVMVVYNLTDTLFVGMLNDPVQTSAVTLVAAVILLFNAVNNLFGVGCSSIMSRALGRKDYKTVQKASAFGIWCSILCGLLFTLVTVSFQKPLLTLLGATAENYDVALAYMKWTVFYGAAPAILNVVMGNLVRAEGSAAHATVGTVSGCLLNILLDPLFILPQFLDMGAEGAGLATFIGNTVACLYFFLYIILRGEKTFVSFSPRLAKPERGILKEVFGVGVPAAIQNILNVTGMTILNNRMAVYGTAALSAMGIAHKIALLPMYLSMGLSQGIMPLIGYNYAAGNKKRIRAALAMNIKVGIAVTVTVLAVFLSMPERIIGLFMEHKLVVAYGAAFLRGLSLATPFLMLDFLGVAVFQACGKGRYSLIFAIARKIGLEIPAILLLDRLFPMYGPAYAQLCAEIVLAVAAIVLLRRIVGKKSLVGHSPHSGRRKTTLPIDFFAGFSKR